MPTPRPLEPQPPLGGAHRLPHICFVAPTTWPVLAGENIPVIGGAELQQSLIAKTLARRGYRVSMVSIDYGQADGTVVEGVRIYNMHKPFEGIPVLRFVHPRLTSLWRAMKRVNADIYYQRTAAAYTGFMAAFCKANGKKSVYAGASDVDFIPGQQTISFTRDKKLYEYGLRRVDTVIVQNQNQQKYLREHYGREGLLVPNFYDAPPNSRAERRGGYALWVATVRAQKRPELVLEFARRMPQHKFVMIGGSDIGRGGEEYLRKFRELASAVPNIEFKGFMPFEEADRWFSGARVVLNTSVYEGFPNTFLQAWARGVPTVGFVDTGSRRDGQPVYDIATDMDDATARIARLMSDDLAWEKASQRVLAHHRENHSVEGVAGLYEREFGHLAPNP